MELTPGTIIAGRYRLERKVGAGGMGEVWAGEHLAVGSRVAVKTLLSAAACNHEVVARFKREAYILGRIRSDHVARVVDFVADDTFGLVLVMEFVEGEPLSRVLAHKVLNVEETIDLGVDIASALCDLHRAHIVHRDLKPGNIILQPLHAGRFRAVVVDFGVSRLNSSGQDDDEEITGITRADMAVGTIEYMAPEQILNSRNVTSTSDIYATGAILFRAVVGQHIFGNPATDTELAQKKLTTEPPPLPLGRTDKIAQGLAEVVQRAIRRRPAERYQSADEMLAALLALRDQARAGAAAFEATTVDQKVPLAAAEPTDPGRSSQDMAGRPSRASALPSMPTRPSASGPPRARGVSPALLAGAVIVALGGGVGLGMGLFRASAETQPSPTTAPSAAPSAPTESAAPTDAPAAPAAPTESAAPAETPPDTPSAAATDAKPEAPGAAPAATLAPKPVYSGAPPAPVTAVLPKPSSVPSSPPNTGSTEGSAPAPSPIPSPIKAPEPSAAPPPAPTR